MATTSRGNPLINQVWEKYKRYVSDFPETVSQIEATSRLLSYIIAGNTS